MQLLRSRVRGGWAGSITISNRAQSAELSAPLTGGDVAQMLTLSGIADTLFKAHRIAALQPPWPRSIGRRFPIW